MQDLDRVQVIVDHSSHWAPDTSQVCSDQRKQLLRCRHGNLLVLDAESQKIHLGHAVGLLGSRLDSSVNSGHCGHVQLLE